MLWTLGCAVLTESTRPRQLSIFEAVSGEARRYLLPDGRFEFPDPEPDGSPIVALDSARRAAEFLARLSGPTGRASLEAGRRSPINFAELRACGPAYYGVSPFNEIPNNGPPEFAFYVGPHWLIGLCDRRGPAVSVAVAGHAGPTQVSGGWLIPFGSMTVMAIAPGWAGALPATAESAVLLVARLVSRRVVSIPELYAPAPGSGFPQGAFWAINLDREATFIGTVSGRRITTNRIYVGSLPDTSSALRRGPVRLFLEAVNGRRVFSYDYRVMDPSFFGTLTVRSGTALDFEPVTVAP